MPISRHPAQIIVGAPTASTDSDTVTCRAGHAQGCSY